MDVRYFIDPTTRQPHIYSHDVAEEEVEEVLQRAEEDRPGAEGTRIAIGYASNGRILRVIYVPEPAGSFVITAYDLRGKALSAFRRRQRRKRQ